MVLRIVTENHLESVMKMEPEWQEHPALEAS